MDKIIVKFDSIAPIKSVDHKAASQVNLPKYIKNTETNF